MHKLYKNIFIFIISALVLLMPMAQSFAAGNNLIVSNSFISISDLYFQSSGVEKIILTDVSLKVDMLNARLPEVVLNNDIVLIVSDENFFGDKLIISNVSGSGAVSAMAPNLNPLFVLQPYVDNDNLFLSYRRETDYGKVLKNHIGDFLNELRVKDNNNKLLIALDNATDMQSINSILDKSVVMNPVQLMSPVRVMNSFQMLDMNSVKSGVSPFFISSDVFSAVGARADFGLNIASNISATLGLYASLLKYSDEVSDFSAIVYGVNLSAKYDKDNIVMRGKIGSAMAGFNSGEVISHNDIITNPTGLGFYSAINAGYKFYIADTLYLIPFAELKGDFISVAGQSDFDFYPLIGWELMIEDNDFNIGYQYGFLFKTSFTGDLESGLRMSAWSDDDAIGFNADISTVYNKIYGASYQIKFGIDFTF